VSVNKTLQQSSEDILIAPVKVKTCAFRSVRTLTASALFAMVGVAMERPLRARTPKSEKRMLRAGM
jgi:hypothetical protein